MNYFGMSYKEVLDSPLQRLLLLSKSISKPKTGTGNKKAPSILEFAKQNKLIKDK